MGTVNQPFFAAIYFQVFVIMDIFAAIYFSRTAELDYARTMYNMSILTFTNFSFL